VSEREVIMGNSLALTTSRAGPVVTIEVAGEVDIANAEFLAEQVRCAEKTDADRIVIDLAGVTFIDSIGLTQLSIAQRRSDADSDRLRLRNVGGHTAKVIAITHLDEVLRIEADS
jgi:anti-sigma B factor antagonist